MKKSRLIALVSSVVVIAGVFAGCGNSKNEAPQDKQVTLKVGMWSSSPAETKLIDDQIAEFNKSFPKIKIEKEVITGDYNQAMQTRIASKTEPDIFYLDVSLASAYIQKNAIAPIDQYLDKEDLKDFKQNLLDGYTKDGKVYGLPKDYNSLALFYNEEMFNKAGVTAPKNWAELENVAKKLTSDKVKGMVLSYDSARFAPFIFQAGGNIIENGKPAFTSDSAVKGFDYYMSMFKKGYATDPKTLGEGWSGDAFANGKAAMCIEGGWMIPFMKEKAPNLKYGIANLPSGEKQGNFAFTVAYVMGKDTKNPKEAAEAIKFLTGKKAQEMTAESGLAIPTRQSLDNAYISKFPERKALVEGAVGAQVFSYGFNHAKIQDELGKAAEKVGLGKADSKTALDEALKAVQ